MFDYSQPDGDLVSLDATISNGEWDIVSAVARPYYYPSTYKIGTGECRASLDTFSVFI